MKDSIFSEAHGWQKSVFPVLNWISETFSHWERRACGKCSSLRGIFSATQITLRGVAAFIVGRRAGVTSLNTGTNSHVRMHTKAHTRRHMAPKKKTNIDTDPITEKDDWKVRAHGWDPSQWKRVWNESEACCAVGRVFNTCLDAGERSRPLAVSWSMWLTSHGWKQLAASSLTQNWVSVEPQLCWHNLWGWRGAEAPLFRAFMFSCSEICHLPRLNISDHTGRSLRIRFVEVNSWWR